MKKKKRLQDREKKPHHILYSSAVPVKFKPAFCCIYSLVIGSQPNHNRPWHEPQQPISTSYLFVISCKDGQWFQGSQKETTHSWVCNKGHRNSMKVRQRKTNRICICFLRFTATTLIIQLLFHLTNKSRNFWTCICSALITTTSRPVCFKHGQT